MIERTKDYESTYFYDGGELVFKITTKISGTVYVYKKYDPYFITTEMEPVRGLNEVLERYDSIEDIEENIYEDMHGEHCFAVFIGSNDNIIKTEAYLDGTVSEIIDDVLETMRDMKL